MSIEELKELMDQTREELNQLLIATDYNMVDEEVIKKSKELDRIHTQIMTLMSK